jgi:regulation of enolase protein 1 (concanavalin A-like superfamily)
MPGGALAATYDAAVLMLYVNEHSWAKLCLELSPQGEPMIVSVVTNASPMTAIRSCCPAQTHGCAWPGSATPSPFTTHWTARPGISCVTSPLHERADLRVGFSVQSPVGEGCTATFTEIRYQPVALADLRSGV